MSQTAFGFFLGFVLIAMLPFVRDSVEVTRCRLCNKTVWIWQRHERRDMSITEENTGELAVFASGSCIVHSKCKGTPTGKVSIE